MTKNSILLIESNETYSNMVSAALSPDYSLVHSYDGLDGWIKIQTTPFNLVIANTDSKILSGFEIVNKMNLHPDFKDIPTILLSECKNTEQLHYAFEMGCDHYMSIPFSSAELLCHTQSLLSNSTQATTTYTLNDLIFNPLNHSLTINSTPVNLSHKEFKVFQLLIAKKNRTVSREFMLSDIWGRNSNSSLRSIDIIITRLRSKLKEYSSCIKTVTHFGYQWQDI